MSEEGLTTEEIIEEYFKKYGTDHLHGRQVDQLIKHHQDRLREADGTDVTGVTDISLGLPSWAKDDDLTEKKK